MDSDLISFISSEPS